MSTTMPRRLALAVTSLSLIGAGSLAALPASAVAAAPAPTATHAIQTAPAAHSTPASSGTIHASAAKTTAAKKAAQKTVTTQIRWANGSTVKAQVLSATAGSSVKAASVTPSKLATKQFGAQALADGRLVILKKGAPYTVDAKGKVRAYFTGKAPIKADTVLVNGNSVYAVKTMKTGSWFTEYTGAKRKAKNTTWLPGTIFTDHEHLVVSKGRVYYQHDRLSPATNDGPRWITSSDVRSVKLGARGTGHRTEARNAMAPMPTHGQVAVVTQKANAGGLFNKVTGARVLGGKKLFSVKGTWSMRQYGQMDEGSQISISGDTIAMENGAGRGVLVMNLKTKKATFVKAPKNRASVLGHSQGGRVAFTWMDLSGDVATRQISVVASSTGRQLRVTSTVDVLNASINGRSLGYVVDGKSVTTKLARL